MTLVLISIAPVLAIQALLIMLCSVSLAILPAVQVKIVMVTGTFPMEPGWEVLLVVPPTSLPEAEVKEKYASVVIRVHRKEDVSTVN